MRPSLILISFLLWIAQWITIPTAIMFPVLVLMYYRLAKKEEEEMEQLFGDEYRKYRLNVPMFLPTGLLKASNRWVIAGRHPLNFGRRDNVAT